MSVYNHNYVRYDGELNLKHQAWRIAKRNLLVYLSFTRTKILLGLLWIPFPLFTVIALIAARGMSDFFDMFGLNTDPTLRSMWSFLLAYQYCSIGILFAASASGVISDDEKFKTFQFYFSKPIPFLDYLIGKFLSLLLLAALVSVIPTILTLSLRLLLYVNDPLLWDIIKVSLLAVFMSCFIASILAALMMGLSSLSERKGLVTLLWIGTFVIPLMISFTLLIGTSTNVYAPFFNFIGLINMMSDLIFEINAKEGPRWLSIVILTGVGSVSAIAAYLKLKKLTHSGI